MTGADHAAATLGAAAAVGKPALVMGGGGALSYGRLRAQTDRAAALLAAQGLRFGDHIALLFGNEPQLFPFAWAAQRTGLYYTPVNWHLTPEEAAYIVADCDAAVLVASRAHAGLARRIARDVPSVTLLEIDAEPPPVTGAPEGLPQAWEGFSMFYSSGTTGHPKGIAREAVRVPVGTPGTFDGLMREGFGFGADMVYLCPGPLYHAAPLAWSMATQRAGGTAVVMERFDALETLELIERHRVTHVQFVPTMMRRLLRLPEADRRRCDLSSLRVVVHAAAPCPPEVKRGMIDWLGPIVHEFYAGSEGNGFFTIGSEEWLAHPGSVGRASYGTAHVLDDDGNELPPGEVGTIWFEGTARFRYHNDPGKTAGAFNDRGWSTLGDVGHLDADGYLYLSDRRVDLILSGGVNIYPQEIEDTLCRNKNVFDAAVIGAPDEEMGQRVLAVVQPDPAAHAGRALADELFAHCREHLAGFKCPREITFSHELPRLPTGKLLRRRVREDVAGRPSREFFGRQ
ncbi:AMP-binding protein [Actinomadura madurae]|uniref:AMP-binding protein n=2 Tax=Actinomadura madurae TaxID=1993 RepID=UPI0020D220D0|nr:AMP-binding protein [Actinomadura madurae]MCQ0010934.1 AMP-binding protein [Actinomadura madurae]